MFCLFFLFFFFFVFFVFFFYTFFFQAEDGIRDGTVTGVQTCALPICRGSRRIGVAPLRVGVARDGCRPCSACARAAKFRRRRGSAVARARSPGPRIRIPGSQRSEERRVGKECGSGGWWLHQEKNKRE